MFQEVFLSLSCDSSAINETGYSENLCNLGYVNLIYEVNKLVWDIKCQENGFINLKLSSLIIICLNGKEGGVI